MTGGALELSAANSHAFQVLFLLSLLVQFHRAVPRNFSWGGVGLGICRQNGRGNKSGCGYLNSPYSHRQTFGCSQQQDISV